jgi:hypothetical protein
MSELKKGANPTKGQRRRKKNTNSQSEARISAIHSLTLMKDHTMPPVCGMFLYKRDAAIQG